MKRKILLFIVGCLLISISLLTYFYWYIPVHTHVMGIVTTGENIDKTGATLADSFVFLGTWTPAIFSLIPFLNMSERYKKWNRQSKEN